MDILHYGVSICLFQQLKHKYAQRIRIPNRDVLWCDECFHLQYFLLDCIFSVLIDKTKICIFRRDDVSHVINISVQKITFFWLYFLCDHYALRITQVIHKIILLFFRFEFAQESKNFWKMDKIDVQNRDRRNTFGKIRRALGILRNFFGSMPERPYMLWCFLHIVKIQISLAI